MILELQQQLEAERARTRSLSEEISGLEAAKREASEVVPTAFSVSRQRVDLARVGLGSVGELVTDRRVGGRLEIPDTQHPHQATPAEPAPLPVGSPDVAGSVAQSPQRNHGDPMPGEPQQGEPESVSTDIAGAGSQDPRIAELEASYWLEYWVYERKKLEYNDALLERKIGNLDDLYRQRNAAFTAQSWFGWISMVVVHLLFLMGIFLAYVEAKRAGKAPPSDVQDEIKLSFEQIALKSRYLSVVILGLTLGFYMLYLKFVYPITEL